MKLVIANWKSYLVKKDSQKLSLALKKLSFTKFKVILAPTAAYFCCVQKAMAGKFKLAGQNVYSAYSGAYTGELTVHHLLDFGCEYCFVGHSERRIYLGEDNRLINAKIKELQKENIVPVLCVGEDNKEHQLGHTFSVLKKQLQAGLKGVNIKKIIVAYEPIWAISGFSQSREPEIAWVKQVAAFIRKQTLNDVKILYGGSVNEKNMTDFLEAQFLSGVLVGQASTKLSFFKKLACL